MLHKIHKKICAGLMAVLLAFSLTACNFSAVQNALQQIQDSKEPDAAISGGSSAPAEKPTDNPSRPGDIKNDPGTEASGGGQKGEFLSLFIESDSERRWQGDTYEILLCETAWDHLYLDPEDAERYPALNAVLEQRNQENADAMANTLVELQEMAEDELSYLEEGRSPNYSYTEAISIQRADKTALSTLCRMESYTGGMHSLHSFWGVNLNPETGEELTLGEVFRNPDGVPALVARLLTEKYGEYEDLPEEEMLREYLQGCMEEGNLQWVLGYQNVTFLFAPYEILSYAAGAPAVSVWFADTPELFREGIVPAEKQYAISLKPYQEIPFDLDSRDGHVDTIYVYEAPGPDYEDMGDVVLEVSINGERFSPSLSDEDYSYFGCDLSLLHLGDGKNYLYIDAMTGGGFSILSVYDMDGMRLAGRFVSTGFHHNWELGIGRAGAVITDPAAFLLDTQTEVLSTITAADSYTADPGTGLPVRQADYYDISACSFVITSLRPLEVLMLPAEKTEQLPAGTTFTFLRTDNETYVDLRLEDGQECRVLVDVSQWPVTVGGVPREDCFDGMMFAG